MQNSTKISRVLTLHEQKYINLNSSNKLIECNIMNHWHCVAVSKFFKRVIFINFCKDAFVSNKKSFLISKPKSFQKKMCEFLHLFTEDFLLMISCFVLLNIRDLIMKLLFFFGEFCIFFWEFCILKFSVCPVIQINCFFFENSFYEFLNSFKVK